MIQQNDPTAAAARSKPRWRILFMTVVAIFVGVFEEEIDPFGLDTATDQLSANIYSTITSPFYGKTAKKIELQIKTAEQEHKCESEDNNKHSTESFDTRWGQSNVIVLLIDDHYLNETEQSWPLDPRRYRQVLATLVEAGASAVFLDIYFNQDSKKRVKQVASLFKESRELAVKGRCAGASTCCEQSDFNDGTAIYFASSRKDPEPQASPKQAPTAEDPKPQTVVQVPSGVALAGMVSEYNAYKLYETPVAELDQQRYPTAAWQLYRAWCVRNEDCDKQLLEKFPHEQMYLQWGFAPNQVMTEVKEFAGASCQKMAVTFPDRLVQSLEIFLVNMFLGKLGDRIAPCPYQTQMNLLLLNQLSEADRKDFFKGKVVLIGTYLKHYPDNQWSPVHNTIPGVFWHANAVDNLIEYSSNYMKLSQSAIGQHFETIGLVLVFIIQGLLSYAILKRHEDNTLTDAQKAGLDLLHGLFIICLISATVLIATGIMRWAPANWIGFAMLMLIIDAKPVTAIPRFCWYMFPITRIAHKGLSRASNYFLTFVISIILLIAGYVLFLLPHAILLQNEWPSDSTKICYGFLLFYIAVCVYCTGKITQWRIIC